MLVTELAGLVMSLRMADADDVCDAGEVSGETGELRSGTNWMHSSLVLEAMAFMHGIWFRRWPHKEPRALACIFCCWICIASSWVRSRVSTSPERGMSQFWFKDNVKGASQFVGSWESWESRCLPWSPFSAGPQFFSAAYLHPFSTYQIQI